MLNYKIYIDDILNAIDKIEKSIEDLSEKVFEKKEDIWDATLMRIQVIGESIKKIPFRIKKKYPEIEWKRFSNTRDIISHAYSQVNKLIIWNLIKNKLSILKEQIQKIKDELN